MEKKKFIIFYESFEILYFLILISFSKSSSFSFYYNFCSGTYYYSFIYFLILVNFFEHNLLIIESVKNDRCPKFCSIISLHKSTNHDWTDYELK